MPAPHVVLPGGSGFLGQALSRDLLAHGYQVTVLTRKPRGGGGPVRELGWDGRTLGPWASSLEGAAAVVNFTGRSVNCRYTPENRREIVESRLDAVKVLGQAIRACAAPPAAWVQAGSLAIFGDAGPEPRDETSPVGEGFSPEVCKAWEAAFQAELTPQTRKVYLRISFALGRDGGALSELSTLARRFLGGRVGSGRQMVSWIHLDDLNEMFRWAIERPEVSGLYHATGPQPVSNADFMAAIRRAVGRPWSPPTPAWAVKLGARMMGSEGELALSGRRGVAARFLAQGFTFKHPDLDEALGDLLGAKP